MTEIETDMIKIATDMTEIATNTRVIQEVMRMNTDPSLKFDQ